MCLTREQWNKHKEAIEWFYEQPEGTHIWHKEKNSKKWFLTLQPSWEENMIYIINDEYAELRELLPAKARQLP